MKLSETEAWDRLGAERHGVLGTVHRDRGVDLVPVVYAFDDEHTLFIPIDAVKAKITTRLQRLANLSSDPRCTLLVDGYDADWSRLWWVRVNGEGRQATLSEVKRFAAALAERYPQYAEPGSIVSGIVIIPTAVTGWRAAAG